MLARRNFLIAGMTLVVSGCGSDAPPPPAPGVIELELNAAPDVNPTKAGRPSPVTVSVYQLASRGAFDRADFFQLGKPEYLAADQRARDDIVLTPGEKRSLTVPLKDGARYVAIVAAFQVIDRASWHAVAEVPPNGTTKLAASLSGTTLTFQQAGK